MIATVPLAVLAVLTLVFFGRGRAPRTA